MTLFLSYSTADQEIAGQLAMALLAESVKVWKDDLRIRPGDQLSEEIVTAIETCSFFCILLSTESVASDWVQRELDVALACDRAGTRGFLIPVLLDDCEIPESLEDLRFIDFREESQRGIRVLVGHVARTYSVAHSGRSEESFKYWFDYTLRTYDVDERSIFELDLAANDK